MKKKHPSWRALSLAVIFVLLFCLVALRLFYWQVLAGERLNDLAKGQYHFQKEIPALRGEILAADGSPLITNQKAYLLYSSLPNLNQPAEKIASLLAPFLVSETDSETSFSGDLKIDQTIKKEKVKEEQKDLVAKLELNDMVWIALQHRLPEEVKQKIESLDLKGIGFEEEAVRFYPEASMAAHLLGFVGKDEEGKDIGYSGLEGFYDIELKGRPGLMSLEKDALNEPILIGSFFSQERKDGQSLILHLDRTVQFIVERKLKEAVEKYKAKSGSVVIMNPENGGVVALADYPSFDPKKYYQYDKSLFKNSVISDAYEPGSTFKIFVMAAAIDNKAVKPETKCDICDKPFKIDKYEIKTWDEKYYPNSNMSEVIQHSDNLGMVFTARKLGFEDFWNYLNNFGFGEQTKIDLQGEISASLRQREKWSEVDLVTAAFGQGIATTGIQMIRACAAVANGGKLLEPHVVEKIISGEKTIDIKPKVIRQVIQPKTAKIITEMMVQAVEEGEAKYLKIPGFKIAGKTGTSQIPVAGHYDEEKTIASFIGFAPASKPKFVMLVKLREPGTSPWGSETAAPLFFSISRELLIYYGVQPD